MARNRTRRSWTRERHAAAEPDAPFFEDAAKWRPRPDSPEVSLFTPAEEAESHRRWQRAMLRERLRGSVTEAERLGLGLSAAALAALAAAERESREGEEFDEQRDDGSGDVGEVLRALKSGASGQAEKGPVAAKAAPGPPHAFLDTTGGETAVSSAVASRTDNGLSARRAAPRGSGSPLESRVGGGERADGGGITVLRKAESASSDARSPFSNDGALAAVRGPSDADVGTIAMAAAMAFDVPMMRDERDGAPGKSANNARADAARA
ncbi:MAG TPA: hypothetical protein VEX11_06165, partial [Acetobacteraceae bacterium]|nr:hypothetical protein [Acetobacteraceae bacterium]